MPDNFLNKNDLKNLFPGEKAENRLEVQFEPSKPLIKKSRWQLYLKFFGLFIGLFLLSFLAVNFSAFEKKLGYFWDVQLRHQSYQKAVATPSATPSFNLESQAKLVIPKIGVDTPIVWNVPEDQVNEKLLGGVVHSRGTALPGQKGNIFITGHSSYYSWSSSPYKDVFALLEKLSLGDKIYVQYQGINFNYEVKDTKVVSPNDLSVLDQGNDFNLTLMTCVPIGTNLNRLIITSTQIPN